MKKGIFISFITIATFGITVVFAEQNESVNLKKMDEYYQNKSHYNGQVIYDDGLDELGNKFIENQDNTKYDKEIKYSNWDQVNGNKEVVIDGVSYRLGKSTISEDKSSIIAFYNKI